WLLDIIVPQMAAGNIVRQTMVDRVMMYNSRQDHKPTSLDAMKTDNKEKKKGGLVVASTLLSEYPNPQTLIHEIFGLFAAGVYGPAWTIAACIFNIVTNPDIYTRIMAW